MSPEASIVGGDQSVEELRRELAEAKEQQAASAGILAAMSNSPTDPYRVFAQIAASAARLCDANDSQIRQVDGSTLRLVAHHGSIATDSVVNVTRELVAGRAEQQNRRALGLSLSPTAIGAERRFVAR